MSALSNASGIGDMSDVAFIKRLINCSGWFKWMLERLTPTSVADYLSPRMILNKFERRLISVILQKVIDNVEKQTEGKRIVYKERYENWVLQLTEGQYLALQGAHAKLTKAD